MSLPLKVTITRFVVRVSIIIVRINQTKTMKFAPNMSVYDTCKAIREKIGEEGTGADHGLFQSAVEGKRPARWLRNDRTLAYYDLQPNVNNVVFDYNIKKEEVIYKKKHRTIKVKLQDDTIKTVLVDDTLTVGEIVSVIGNKLSIGNPEEFSLKNEAKRTYIRKRSYVTSTRMAAFNTDSARTRCS